jgi:hypothetical protein
VTAIEKQYLRATGSSDLRCNELDERPTDVDVIFAAGTSGETLASCLLRLRGEYDAVRGDGRRLHQLAQADEKIAKDFEAMALLEAAKKNRGPTRTELYREQARAVRRVSDNRTAHAHRMVILQLKTLPVARMLLRNFIAHETGTDQQVTDHLVRSVIRAFLVDKCLECGGRGFNGGNRQPTIRCATCKERGEILIDWGSLEAELFGRQLLTRIDVKVENLQRHMSKRVRS